MRLFIRPYPLNFILCFFLILFAGCSNTNPPDPVGPSTGIAVSPSESPTSQIVPHTEPWIPLHGTWVNQNGIQVCLNCHKISSTDVERAPTCFSCHPFPHTEGWVQKENHGAYALAQGQNVCTLCHGDDFKGGISEISCNTCHTIFPHTASWADPGEHGNVAKGDGKNLCKGCHGDDFNTMLSGKSCKSCHNNVYPHPTDWRNKENHGQWVATNGSASCATQCHGTDLSGGLSGVACRSCHNGIYPHAAGWQDNHGATANRLGKAACQDCHGSDFKQMLAGKNCFSCHADYPHPESTTWIPFQGGHGERVKTNGSTDACKLCHGTDLKTVKPDGRNCFSCHASYPHQIVSSTWNTFDGHARYVLETAHGSKEECKNCHGTDLRGGNRGNPTCFNSACHASYPHLDGWLRPVGQTQEHAVYAHSNGTTSCATAHCHGVGLVSVAGVTYGLSCTGCHQSYPHIPDWALGTNHGRQALVDTNITGCKACHGDALDRRTSTTLVGHGACAECHPSYTRHRSALLVAATDNHWARGTEHGTYVLDPSRDRVTTLTECQKCHGSDYRGGLSGQSCKDSSCHETYPHLAGWAPSSDGHASDHGPQAAANFNACRACHGADLNIAPVTGHGSCSAASCHPSYAQHRSDGIFREAWRTFDGHGAFLMGPLGSTPPPISTRYNECKTCHGSDLSRNINDRNCNSCHQNYPHPAGWADPSNHGHFVRENGSTSCAQAQCHGTGLIPTTETRGTNCASSGCHTDFPHLAGWGPSTDGSTSRHGTVAISGTEIEACKACHGADLSNEMVASADPRGRGSCVDCHAVYSQHGRVRGVSTWTGPGAGSHGPYIRGASGEFTKAQRNAKLLECKTCHGANFDAPIPSGNCRGCHVSYPHQDSTAGRWIAGAVHGAAAISDLNNCKTCHGAGLNNVMITDTAAASTGSCVSCHSSYAQHRRSTETPTTPSLWPTTGHGQYVLGPVGARNSEAVKATKLTECQTCHGADYSGGISGTACRSCHESYPQRHIPGATWGTYAGHGASLMGAPGSTPAPVGTRYNDCKLCHGNDLRTDVGSSGTSGTTCYSCHQNYPHLDLDAWRTGQHGSVVRSSGTRSCAEAECHGTGLIPTTGVTRGPSCSQTGCHSNFPHTTGWYPVTGSSTISTHGTTAISDIDSCKRCHGADLGNVLSSTGTGGHSCNNCHSTYSRHARVAGSTTPLWRDAHGAYINGASREFTRAQRDTNLLECKTCHGEHFDAIPSANCSRSCHSSYPHQDGTAGRWITGAAHGAAAISDINNCKTCHGAGLNNVMISDPTATSTGACTSCHASYARHPRATGSSSTWSSTEHGQYILGPVGARYSAADRAAKLTECQACHGSDYSGGLAGVACRTCHESYPQKHAQSGWGTYNDSGNGHGNHVLVNLDNVKASCKLCHGTDLRGGNSGVDCSNSGCHANYPHGDPASARSLSDEPITSAWISTGHGPASLVGASTFSGPTARVNNCGSANCHGPTLSGRVVTAADGTRIEVYTCTLCHTEFPHETNPAWLRPGRTSPGEPKNHALKMIEESRVGGNCYGCHGSSYERRLGGIACTDCHTSGVTHTASWWVSGPTTPFPASPEHGNYLHSVSFTSATSATQNCKDCHGHVSPINDVAVDFLPTDIRSSLETRSDCYRCHWAYPHKSFFARSPLSRAYDWSLGHAFYVTDSPLFVDETGARPSPTDPTDFWTVMWASNFSNARRVTCEQGGGCHSSRRTSTTMCSTACHPVGR
ncbi:MAG: hypothetical protein HQM15_08035 [Deltaproteobacteria bacterium]|nr:hypothetical protein [Deltaproteobacteria bacterium]